MDKVCDETWTGVGGNGIISSFSYANDVITGSSRWSSFINGGADSVSKLFVFGAKKIFIGKVLINPPSRFDEDDEYSSMEAYYYPYNGEGDEQLNDGIVIYFLDQLDSYAVSEWDDDSIGSFSQCISVLELHELTHWAVPDEDNETGSEHWKTWNTVLCNVVSYVSDHDDWNIIPYETEWNDETLETTVGSFVPPNINDGSGNEKTQSKINTF